MTDIVALERGLQALLGRLMGPPGTGQLTVRSTEATGLVPACSFAVPVGYGDFDEEAGVFVPKNPGRSDGAWEVTSAGTSIPVESLQGGIVGNHDAGTSFRWYPTLDGIEEVSWSGEITGGVNDDSLGSLRQLKPFKAFKQKDWQDFYNAQLGSYPAAGLAWESMTALDGPNHPSPGRRNARAGSRGIKYKHTWALFLVTTRFDSDSHRRTEGATLMQRVVNEIVGRTGARGWRVSGSPGLNLLAAGIEQTRPTSYVDLVRFESIVVLKTKSAEQGTPWAKTRVKVDHVNDAEDDREPLNKADVTVDMTPGDDSDD